MTLRKHPLHDFTYITKRKVPFGNIVQRTTDCGESFGHRVEDGDKAEELRQPVVAGGAIRRAPQRLAEPEIGISGDYIAGEPSASKVMST